MLARDGRPPKHRDQVLRNLEAGIIAEVAPGPLGLRDDLELPDLPTRPAKRPPARDRMAERRAAQTRAAIEAAERRVQRARDELERAESELGGLLERERAEPS